MKETGELFISVHCSKIAFTPSEDIIRINDFDTYNHRYIFDENNLPKNYVNAYFTDEKEAQKYVDYLNAKEKENER